MHSVAATEHVEIERKFDVGEAFVLPDLAGVPGVASIGAPVVHELDATYYDTADLRLARAHVTLRRRLGGTDAGWHLKLPAAAGARRELHSPLGRAVKAPPRAVITPVLGIVRKAPAAAVATLATRRTVRTLLAEDGRVLVEVADDLVTGTQLPAGPGDAAVVTTWREVEVELVDGEEELLGAVGAELVVSGARPSASASKLATVLAGRLAPKAPEPVDEDDDDSPVGEPEVDPVEEDPAAEPVAAEPLPEGTKARAKELARRAAAQRKATKALAKATATAEKERAAQVKAAAKAARKSRAEAEAAAAEETRLAAVPQAGDVVLTAVAAQLVALQRADLMVRTDVPDGVHQVRVASRRLRSVFAAYRPVLQREVTDPLRTELQWLGQELSGSRDAEVSLEHLRALVAAQPEELVLGPVAARLQQAELQGEAHAGERAGAVLSTARYLTLLDSLFAVVETPPLTGRAGEPAADVLQEVLRHTVKRMRRQVEAAEEAERGDAPIGTAPEHAAGSSGTVGSPYELALHEVRKAGKRVRYTAEVAAPVLGGSVMGLVDAIKKLQDVLGDRQDTVVTREQCRELGSAAFGAGENAWTYGRLHALEEARALRAEEDFWELWPTVGPVLNGAVGRK